MADAGAEPGTGGRTGEAAGVACPAGERAGLLLTRCSGLFGPVYWAFTGVSVLIGVVLVAFFTPVEAEMGAVQKVFYLHLPVAMTTFVACFVVFVASAIYLWQRSGWADALAAAAAEVAVLYCTVVLLTGVVWAKEAWGQWWTWSPRLTLSLVLWLLYVVYLVVRPMIGSPQRRAVVCAVYGVMAFLDVPLVYFSVRLMPEDIHPGRVELAPSMWRVVVYWFVPVLLMCVGFIGSRYRTLAVERTAGGSA